MENLNDNKDINRAGENIKENTKSSVKASLGLVIETVKTMV
jgi:hypothetical protein